MKIQPKLQLLVIPPEGDTYVVIEAG